MKSHQILTPFQSLAARQTHLAKDYAHRGSPAVGYSTQIIHLHICCPPALKPTVPDHGKPCVQRRTEASLPRGRWSPNRLIVLAQVSRSRAIKAPFKAQNSILVPA